MLLFLLAKRKPCSIILPLFSAHHSPLLSRYCYCSAHPKPPKFNMDDYLIAAFGFSPDKAAKVAKPITRLKSPDNPDAVRGFLSHQGFSEADIKKLITWCPTLLCASPEKTLDPNLRALRDIGLSNSVLTELILSGPVSLQLRSAASRIKFWRNLIGDDNAALVRVFKQNSGLIGHDDESIATKFSLLHSHGFSTHEIARIICRVPQFITRSVTVMEDQLKRAKELGFQPGSRMFALGLEVTVRITRESLQKKMDLLKSFGWSEDKFLAAVRKAPVMATLSDENLRAKMDFWLGEARCEISYITFHPLLLQFSLEERLKPRLRVLRLLESKGISIQGQGFYYVMRVSNSKFVEKYILRHKDKIPELCDMSP